VLCQQVTNCGKIAERLQFSGGTNLHCTVHAVTHTHLADRLMLPVLSCVRQTSNSDSSNDYTRHFCFATAALFDVFEHLTCRQTNRMITVLAPPIGAWIITVIGL